MKIEFTVPGKVTSANLVTRHRVQFSKRLKKWFALAYKAESAVDDAKRIASIALEAKIRCGWIVPNVAALEIYAYNSRLDVGNAEKVISDSIKGGLLIVDDRKEHLESLFVRHMAKDHLGERYVVRVLAAQDVLPLEIA